jgi:hypothetical protein
VMHWGTGDTASGEPLTGSAGWPFRKPAQTISADIVRQVDVVSA